MAGRVATAVMRFSGTPDRETEAAEAWAFELKIYFKRRVGEQPKVVYSDGVYTCTGLMTTSHPGDHGDPVVFDADAEPASLDRCVNQERRARLRELYDGPTWG